MNRRKFMAIGALAAAGCRPSKRERAAQRDGAVVSLRDAPPAPSCPKLAHQTAGPFFVKEPILRREIAEDQVGRALLLRFKVVEEGSCAPRPGALISLFHANASGLYSGFAEQGLDRDKDTTGQSWLRGAQLSDDKGELELLTIYPGWYPGRVTHMHFTASLEDKLVLTSQIYFPDDVVRQVYAEPPYSGWRDTEDDDDPVRARAKRGVLPRLAIERGAERDVATLTISLPGQPRGPRAKPG